MTDHSSPTDFHSKTGEATHVATVFAAESIFASRRFRPGTQVMHRQHAHWGMGKVVAVVGTRSMGRAVLFEGFKPNHLLGFYDDDENQSKEHQVVHCNVAELYVPEHLTTAKPVRGVTFLFGSCP